jgi:hypothetical protein
MLFLAASQEDQHNPQISLVFLLHKPKFTLRIQVVAQPLAHRLALLGRVEALLLSLVLERQAEVALLVTRVALAVLAEQVESLAAVAVVAAARTEP